MTTSHWLSVLLFLVGIAWVAWAPDSEEERTKEGAP